MRILLQRGVCCRCGATGEVRGQKRTQGDSYVRSTRHNFLPVAMHIDPEECERVLRQKRLASLQSVQSVTVGKIEMDD